MSKSVFVSPAKQGGWKVQLPAVETQKEAIDQGRVVAKKLKAELVVQNRVGQIYRKDSFGNDPRSIPG